MAIFLVVRSGEEIPLCAASCTARPACRAAKHAFIRGLIPDRLTQRNSPPVTRDPADAGLLDDLMSGADRGGLEPTGEGGLLPELVKVVLERGLAAELTGHPGYLADQRSAENDRVTD